MNSNWQRRKWSDTSTPLRSLELQTKRKAWVTKRLLAWLDQIPSCIEHMLTSSKRRIMFQVLTSRSVMSCNSNSRWGSPKMSSQSCISCRCTRWEDQRTSAKRGCQIVKRGPLRRIRAVPARCSASICSQRVHTGNKVKPHLPAVPNLPWESSRTSTRDFANTREAKEKRVSLKLYFSRRTLQANQKQLSVRAWDFENVDK